MDSYKYRKSEKRKENKISFRLPNDMFEAIKKAADMQDVSVGHIIRCAIAKDVSLLKCEGDINEISC